MKLLASKAARSLIDLIKTIQIIILINKLFLSIKASITNNNINLFQFFPPFQLLLQSLLIEEEIKKK